MTTKNSNTTLQQLRPILSYINDLPNICSIAGLGCSLIAIYYLVLGVFSAAMIGMIWAVAFDWADGLIARRMKWRSDLDSQFGGQLDLLIDIVSYGVTPAILVLSYADFNLLFLPVAFVMLVFGALRLSYFSTFGLSSDSKYTGLAIDNNSIILVFLFIFSGYFERLDFSIFLAIVGLILAILNISQIKTPKLSGNPMAVGLLAIYTLTITFIYARDILMGILST